MLAPISGCVVGVAGILQAWCDMWFIPAGSQIHNKNDTYVYAAMLLTWADRKHTQTHTRSWCQNQHKLVENTPDFAANVLLLRLCCNVDVIVICRTAAQRPEKMWGKTSHGNWDNMYFLKTKNSTTITSFILVTIYPSMRHAYLRMGGLTTMRNSEAVRQQWLLSQSSSSRGKCSVLQQGVCVCVDLPGISRMLHTLICKCNTFTLFRNWSNQTQDPTQSCEKHTHTRRKTVSEVTWIQKKKRWRHGEIEEEGPGSGGH